MVDQLADLFRTTHKVKTQQVVKSRGQHCGDIELAGYLANEAGSVPLVLDLRIAHDRVGSSADPSLNGHLKYPNNLDQSLNDAAADKIRKYRADYCVLRGMDSPVPWRYLWVGRCNDHEVLHNEVLSFPMAVLSLGQSRA
jgi:hypothetical protein